jgi:hypothetical protein
MKNQKLIVLESSFLLKKILKKNKIDKNILFIATNGSLNKYKIERGNLKYKSINTNIIDKIKYFKGEVIIATDKDDNGELIALEIFSLNKNAKRLNINIDELSNKEKEFTIDILNKYINEIGDFDKSINFLAKKIQEEINNKNFYEKTGLNLSVDDRILIKALKSNIKILSNLPKWIKHNKEKDLYLYLASALDLNKDINKLYEDTIKEFEEGNISYIRTDMNSHLPITLFNNNKELEEILNYFINIDINKINRKEFEFLSKNIFLISKLLNVGTPSTIMYIYNKVNEYKDVDFKDDIDIYRKLNNKDNLIKFKTNKNNINIDNLINKFNNILNNVKVEEFTSKELLNKLNF